MKTACFIPIKCNSTRVPHKNFRMLGNKPLFKHIIESCLEADCFDDIYIDTDDKDELFGYIMENDKLKLIERDEWYASDDANGNDMIVHHCDMFPQYDVYFQPYATAPLLNPATILHCVKFMEYQFSLSFGDKNEYDSIFTATEELGWYWFNNQPINFRPGILPRSQDATKVVKETTGLYGVFKSALKRYRCRIGANPYAHMVSEIEALDIDTEEDFVYAEYLINR